MAKKRTKSKSRSVQRRKQPVTPEITKTATEESPEELPRDIFDDFLFHAANYLYVRRKLFISLGVALVVILVAVYGGYRLLRYQDNVRNEKIFAIEAIVHGQESDNAVKYEKAKPLLDEFIEANEGKEQFVIALLYRGEISYRNQKYDEAATDLYKVIDSVDPDSELKVLASVYLSNVYREQSKVEDAIDTLNSIQSDKLGDIVLMELAEIYVSENKTEDARRSLEILLKDFPSSGYASRAKEMLDLL